MNIFYSFLKYISGVPGFEPGMPVSKTGALPLGYTPKNNILIYTGDES